MTQKTHDKTASATDKKGFIMYYDYKPQIDCLSMEQRGDLLTCIFEYHTTGAFKTSDAVVSFAMAGLISQFNRDAEKYTDKCKKNASNAHKRWDANGCDRMRTDAKHADRDRESDTDTDSDIIDAKANTPPLSQKDQSTPKPEAESIKRSVPPDFSSAWEAYGRKGNKQIAMRYWLRLREADRKMILAKIPAYVASREQRCFQKDFQGWINPANKLWEDDIVQPAKPKFQTPSLANGVFGGGRSMNLDGAI